jgi:predicted TPR repeat methyltransferase
MDILNELESGVYFHSAGDFSKAEIIYTRILAKHPAHIETLNLKGILMRDSKKHALAAKLFQEAIGIEPSRYDFHFNLAEVYRIENKLEEAIKHYSSSISLNPSFYEAVYNRALCFLKTDCEEKAIYEFKNSLSIKVDADAVLNLISLLISNQKLEEAKEVCKKYRYLKHPRIFNLMGYIYKSLGNYNQAESYLIKAFELDRENVDILNNLSLLFKKTGKLKEAAEMLEKACLLSPKKAFLHYNLAGIYNLSGEKDQAAKHYEISLEYDPNNGSALHMLNAIRGNKTDSAPEEYIGNLFDLYASSFEDDLVNNLQYNIPNKLAAFTREIYPDKKFRHALDAGCGTGLCAVAFQNKADQIIGIDLSAEMVKKASEKNLYNQLFTGEVTKTMTSLNSLNSKLDLIIAADVFIYLGNLNPFFEASSTLLEKNGLLVFSVENCEESFQLQQSGRYAHSHPYLEDLSETHNFKIIASRNTQIRKDMGTWIDGCLYLLVRLE